MTRRPPKLDSRESENTVMPRPKLSSFDACTCVKKFRRAVRDAVHLLSEDMDPEPSSTTSM